MSEHAFARENLAWHVTGVLDERDARRVAAHLATCADCRREVEEERALAAAIGATPVVDMAPQASFARLMSRIDAREARHDRIARWLRPLSGDRAQRPLVFTVAIQAAVIVMLTAVLAAVLLNDGDAPAEYRTLSNVQAGPAVQGPQLRVVVDDTLTLAELRALFVPLDAHIVDGPGANGILTIQVKGASAADAVRALRARAGVRLAEIVAE